jgi:competence protein ComEC
VTGFFLNLKALRQIPFLRIAIPFVAGILFCILSGKDHSDPMLLAICLTLSFTLFLIEKQTKPLKIAFLLISDVFLFLFAASMVFHARIENDKEYYGNLTDTDTLTNIVATVNELPVKKERSVKCELKVIGILHGNSVLPAKGKLIAYFKNSAASAKLNFDQDILIRTKLQATAPPKNPEEFNYESYLSNKQIKHTCFADSNSFAVLRSPSHISSIWKYGLQTREIILEKLRVSGMSEEAFAICAALLTGYDDEIGSELMNAFSHSGTLHVLSVSGLHTGLIYLLILFLLDLVDKNRRFKIARLVLVTLLLWSFALMTGFAAPVLRSVIMFNLMGIGNTFFRTDNRNRINLLLLSAFMLLCYDPFLICDIGFQLSYFAIFGIIFYQPIFESIWSPENFLSKKIWQSITASFAATLTTLPLTLFYFKQFPLWFFICNLVVVPMTFVLLLLTLLVLINITKTVLIIDPLIQFLCAFIRLFNDPGTYIDNIEFNFSDSLLMFAVVVFISAALYYRSFKFSLYSLVFIVVWQLNGIIGSFAHKKTDLFTVYHIRKEKLCSVKNGGTVQLDSVNAKSYGQHVRPQLVSFNHPQLKIAGFNQVISSKENIVWLKQNKNWPKLDRSKISTIVLSDNFKLTPDHLKGLSSLRTIVVDGSNSLRTISRIKEICSKFGINFYNTAESGAFVLNLS